MMVVTEEQSNTYKQRPTQIPVARHSVRGRTPSGSSSDEMMSQDHITGGTSPWRQKYEQAELKRKETLNLLLKASREKDELEKNLGRNKLELHSVRSELDKHKKESDKLKSLSEGMVKEYDQLKNKYELETGAMQQAMHRAQEWYKENRELKRRSAVLVQKVMSVAPSAALDQTDFPDTRQTDELELLNTQIHGLRSQVAVLQAEINSLKLQEFEAQEQVIDLTTSLDEERSKNQRLQQELKEEKTKNSNLDQVTRLAAQDLSALRDQCEKDRTQAIKHKSDADQARKERNVLAHQSQILLCEAAQDEKLMKALFEVENLKRQLEDQQLLNSDLTQKYQEKLAMEEEAPQVELLEEKLKLVESELTISQDRAQRAQQEIDLLKQKIEELEEKGKAPPPPPPPPPPPCPPPFLPSTPVNLRSVSTPNKTNSVLEVANLLGVTRPAKQTVQQGAIEELINEIKGGRFSLKTPERQQKKTKSEEQPPALKEMMNVLGTLRRRPGNRVPSFKRPRNPEMKQATQDITI